jgi:hypothetical protein
MTLPSGVNNVLDVVLIADDVVLGVINVLDDVRIAVDVVPWCYQCT